MACSCEWTVRELLERINMVSCKSQQAPIASNGAVYLQLIIGTHAGVLAADHQQGAFANVNATLK